MDEITTLSQTKGISIATLCEELLLPRSTYYRSQTKKTTTTPATCNETSSPPNALSDESKKAILNLLHSERFIDCTPYQVYYTLLDDGEYYGSIRTFYRLLAEQGDVKDRRNQRSHRDAIKPELMATAPNQVWSWDITKLLSVQRLVYYHLYVIIDIFSRYVVGFG